MCTLASFQHTFVSPETLEEEDRELAVGANYGKSFLIFYVCVTVGGEKKTRLF